MIDNLLGCRVYIGMCVSSFLGFMFHIFLVFFFVQLSICIPDVFDEEAEEDNKEEEDDQSEQEQEV